MRNLILLFASVFLFSCSSVQTLVDKGKYEEAIRVSVNKLAGKKKKDDKYVKTLEASFQRINEEDINKVKYLKIEKEGNYWKDVYSILTQIDKRQRLVKPLMPLISESGYKAKFEFIEIEPLMLEAREENATYMYNVAVKNIHMAEMGDKDAAKMAYKQLEELRDFYQNYKDTDFLKKKVYELGQERVLIDVKNISDVILPKNFFYEVKNINTNDLNRHWYKFYTTEDKVNISFDYVVNINIKEINISPEKEKEREYIENASVVDGFEYLRDVKGEIKKDSTGNQIKKDKMVNVSATVTELGRFKSAVVKGDLKIIDNKNNKVYQTTPVNVETVFETFASFYRGDRRALSKQSIARLKDRIDPFPSNEEILMMSVNDLKKILYNEIDHNLKDK